MPLDINMLSPWLGTLFLFLVVVAFIGYRHKQLWLLITVGITFALSAYLSAMQRAIPNLSPWDKDDCLWYTFKYGIFACIAAILAKRVMDDPKEKKGK